MPPIRESEFADFYRRTARRVWSYAYHSTGSSAEADDITQEAFCRLLQTAAVPEGDEDRRRYVFRIASRLVVDRWRKRTREASWLERLREAFGAGQTRELSLDVEGAFASLRPRDRALLWLAYVEEQDHQHIADAIGVRRASVKVLLSRARSRLREVLQAEGAPARV